MDLSEGVEPMCLKILWERFKNSEGCNLLISVIVFRREERRAGGCGSEISE